jgi:hypothetical protein
MDPFAVTTSELTVQEIGAITAGGSVKSGTDSDPLTTIGSIPAVPPEVTGVDDVDPAVVEVDAEVLLLDIV